jgi:CRP-like cAMP-binding protein
MYWSGVNKVIAGLSARERSLIVPHLRRFELNHGDVLNAPHKPVSHVYFPRSGLLSIVVVFSDGNLAEAAIAGSNTVVGAIAAFGDGTALNQVLVVASGVADRIEAAVLRRLVRESESLRDVLFRHSQALAAQSVQIAGCNAVHALEARLCRWLLQCRDLVSADTLPFTQDLMSSMLGVYRPSLTHVLRRLESARLVAVARGRICILDADALKERSCECYTAIKEQLQIVDAPPEHPVQMSLVANGGRGFRLTRTKV